MKRSAALALVLILGTACGDSTGPTFETIAGTYSGVLTGATQGVAISATFSLTIAQTAGSLSGSWSLSGQLTDGVSAVPITGTGSLTGTIASGGNPSVNITVKNACPNYQANFSGAYDSVNHKLTVSGPADILNDACAVVLSYPSIIVLSR